MLRIWSHTLENTKITRSYIYESIDNFSEENFRYHIEKICHELDIPTPVILKTHINNYIEFNTVTFIKRDFIESIDFEKLVLENASINE